MCAHSYALPICPIRVVLNFGQGEEKVPWARALGSTRVYTLVVKGRGLANILFNVLEAEEKNKIEVIDCVPNGKRDLTHR